MPRLNNIGASTCHNPVGLQTEPLPLPPLLDSLWCAVILAASTQDLLSSRAIECNRLPHLVVNLPSQQQQQQQPYVWAHGVGGAQLQKRTEIQFAWRDIKTGDESQLAVAGEGEGG
jgi:hypothetical protein